MAENIKNDMPSSEELCRMLADTQIILAFPNGVDPLCPSIIEWRKKIDGAQYGERLCLMERDLLSVLEYYLTMIGKQIKGIENELKSQSDAVYCTECKKYLTSECALCTGQVGNELMWAGAVTMKGFGCTCGVRKGEG